ncbi:hypothetical protein JZ751_026600 [Albula glossodonta]|uniref:cGMP-dependent protein kinase interacting domain-containing protein n=1 Tax=Albula glossodonta TaxID=121402 RepID=A0A8T2PEV4_9TELE|nr:hypothetical protein JZ751_026600 [Albula glossodonta]
MRQSRRSTQEAEKSVGKNTDLQRSVQPVSPVITIMPAERDIGPAKNTMTDGDKSSQLVVKDRRRRRAERRSTGVVQIPSGELYTMVVKENELLKEKLQETELLLSQNKVELERLRQSQEKNSERPALLDLERFEKRALERKATELEDELKVLADLRADNQRLKDENAALIRVISKLSK